VLTDGTLLSWGSNIGGQLGYGNMEYSNLPKHVKVCKNGEALIGVLSGQTCEDLGGTLTNLTDIQSVVSSYAGTWPLQKKAPYFPGEQMTVAD